MDLNLIYYSVHTPLYEHDCISSELAGVSCYNGKFEFNL